VPLLLDTNILIPLLEGQFDRMPKSIRESIVEPTDELVSSVASLWEIAIKTGASSPLDPDRQPPG
jgi:PIN domain nuclease of toxin-antitoxin system